MADPTGDQADRRIGEPRPRAPDATERAMFMADAGRMLGTSLDTAATLERVAWLAVPRIADWCAIELLGEDGVLTEVALGHRDPAKLAIVQELRSRWPADPDRTTGSYEIVRSGRASIIPEVTEALIRSAARDPEQADLLMALDLRSFVALPMRTDDGIVGVLTMATDGSGRRFADADVAMATDLADRAAAAIRNAHAYRAADRFRQILDTVADAVFLIDQTGILLDLNQSARDLVGDSRRSVPGGSIDQLLHLDGADLSRTIRAVLRGSGPTRTVNTTIESDRDGLRRPFELHLQRIQLHDEGTGLVVIARDITGRLETEARLERLAHGEHARAAELNAVIRALGHGVVVCSMDGRIRLANPAAEDMFPEVEETTYAEIVGELLDADHEAPPLGRHGGPVVLRTRRDPQRWIELTTSPVTPIGPSGDVDTIVLLRDVSEARHREAVRETFIGILSHELRTPVTTIYGGAKVLARPDSTLDTATRETIFADIAAEAERLHRLVEDVVALNRFGERGGDVGREPVLLQRVIPAVIASEEGRWPSVRFRAVVPAGLPTVVADPTYTEQVLRNLLANAAKYGGPETTVEVLVDTGPDDVSVRILDDGPGIDPTEAERLFELFYRSPSTAATTSGAGIGLFVAARLADAMGGRIWARPRRAGGAEFGFALARMQED